MGSLDELPGEPPIRPREFQLVFCPQLTRREDAGSMISRVNPPPSVAGTQSSAAEMYGVKTKS
jgi:hypothetical protein